MCCHPIFFPLYGPNRTPFGIPVVLKTPKPAPGIDELLILRPVGSEDCADDGLEFPSSVLSSIICKGPCSGQSPWWRSWHSSQTKMVPAIEIIENKSVFVKTKGILHVKTVRIQRYSVKWGWKSGQLMAVLFSRTLSLDSLQIVDYMILDLTIVSFQEKLFQWIFRLYQNIL